MKEKEKRLDFTVTPCFRFGWLVGGGAIQIKKTFISISVSQSMSLWEVLKCSCPKPCLTQNIHIQAQPWMFPAISRPHIHFSSPNPQDSLHLPGLLVSACLAFLHHFNNTQQCLHISPEVIPWQCHISRTGATQTFLTPSCWAIPETVYILKQLESLENFQQGSVMWSDLYFKGGRIGKSWDFETQYHCIQWYKTWVLHT